MAARILVVDDDIPILDAMERGFRIAGFKVTKTFMPREALKMFKAGERFDAVVSDLDMPGMSGAELCEEVQKIADTPFIIQSGNSNVHEIAAACGAHRSFVKPVVPSELAKTINELLGVDQGAGAGVVGT